jgi:DME family drug/metabolite transporter
MRDLRGYTMIMTAAACWGVSATLAKTLQLQGVDTILIVQTRVTFSALLLFAFFLVFKRPHLKVGWKALGRCALLGVIGVAGANFTYYFTIKESTVATGILLQYTAPLLVMVYGAARKEETISFLKVTAASISLFGCFLAVGAYDHDVLTLTTPALISGMGSILCFAFLNVYTRRLVKSYSVWTVILYAITFASIFWLIVNPPWQIIAESPPPETWAWLFLLAIVSVLIPHSLYFSGLQHVVPSRAIITGTLEPVVAIFSAALLLGELLTGLQSLGAVIVLVAIGLLQLQREATPEHRPVISGGSDVR